MPRFRFGTSPDGTRADDVSRCTIAAGCHGHAASTSATLPGSARERLLFANGVVAMGSFHCRPDDPLFPDSGPSTTHCVVFPRTSVWMKHDGQPEFVVDPGIIAMFNEGQAYTRRAIAPDGDRGDWYAVEPGLLAEAVTAVDRQSVRGTRGLFRLSHCPGDPDTYLRQRRLFADVERGDVASLDIEETIVHLLVRVLRQVAATAGRRGVAVVEPTKRRQRDLVEEVRALVVSRYRQRLSLSGIAATVGSSPFHLCKMFRRLTGDTIHRYQTQLRLRAALELLEANRTGELTNLALHLGFSSHSHFTAAFQQNFGLTPSAFASRIRDRSSVDGVRVQPVTANRGLSRRFPGIDSTG